MMGLLQIVFSCIGCMTHKKPSEQRISSCHSCIFSMAFKSHLLPESARQRHRERERVRGRATAIVCFIASHFEAKPNRIFHTNPLCLSYWIRTKYLSAFHNEFI